MTKNKEKSIEQINAEIVQKRQSKEKLIKPALYQFKNNYTAMWFWFCNWILMVFVAIVSPFVTIKMLKERERVIIHDVSAGTFYVSPLLNIDEADEMFRFISKLAATALLNRNPEKLDHEELFKQLFLQKARWKTAKHLRKTADFFNDRKINQDIKVREVISQKKENDQVWTKVTGELRQTGEFEGKEFTDLYSFDLYLKLLRNPRLSKSGKLPYAVLDYKIHITRKASGGK